MTADPLLGDHLQLPRQAMREVGEASQTLGALYRLCDISGETFVSHTKIAELACRPLRTTRRDLEKLQLHKWISNCGRQRFSKSTHRLRRTNTIRLTIRAEPERRPFGVLPRWIAPKLSTWAERALMAVIVSNHNLLQTECIEINFGREGLSLATLEKFTGLRRSTIIAARRRLFADGWLIVDEAEQMWRQSGQITYSPTHYWLAPSVLEFTPLPDLYPQSKCGNAVNSDATIAELSPCLNVATTQSKCGSGGSPKVATGGSKCGSRNEIELLPTSIDGELRETTSLPKRPRRVSGSDSERNCNEPKDETTRDDGRQDDQKKISISEDEIRARQLQYASQLKSISA